jgi:hypothetical protein
MPCGRKGFKGEGNPTYWAELYNGTKDGSGKFLPQGQIEMELACLTQDDADIRPVGSGRDDPTSTVHVSFNLARKRRHPAISPSLAPVANMLTDILAFSRGPTSALWNSSM